MIPHYRVRLRPSAVKQLKGLPGEVLPRMVKTIDSLAGHTRPTGENKLSEAEHLYRLRLGGYRVVYQINDQEGMVLVLSIGTLRDILR